MYFCAYFSHLLFDFSEIRCKGSAHSAEFYVDQSRNGWSFLKEVKGRSFASGP
jgi:hypothetical protein